MISADFFKRTSGLSVIVYSAFAVVSASVRSMLSANLPYRSPRPLGLTARPEESIWYLWPGQVIDVQEPGELDLAVHHVATTRIWGRPVAARPILRRSGRMHFQGWHSRSVLPSAVLTARAEELVFGYQSLRIVGLENEYWGSRDEPLIYAARLAICATVRRPAGNTAYVCVECDISEGRAANGIDKAIMASYHIPRTDEQSTYLNQARLLGPMALASAAPLAS